MVNHIYEFDSKKDISKEADKVYRGLCSLVSQGMRRDIWKSNNPGNLPENPRGERVLKDGDMFTTYINIQYDLRKPGRMEISSDLFTLDDIFEVLNVL